MTLSMDRFSELFDFCEGNDDYDEYFNDNPLLIHENDITNETSPSSSASFDSGVTGYQTDNLITDQMDCGNKIMLDMDSHPSPVTTNKVYGNFDSALPSIEEFVFNEFPFDDVLSLGLPLDTQPTGSNSTASSQDSSANINSIVDTAPLTPERMAVASVDFRKLSYEKLNRSQSCVSYNDVSRMSNITDKMKGRSRKENLSISKQTLPPEGIKITRFPMRHNGNESSSSAPVIIDQNTAMILKLQKELKNAKQEIVRCQRSMEDWKNTAHYALQTAKRIKARLEGNNQNLPSESNSATNNINVTSAGIFSPNLPVQTTCITFQDSANKREAFKRRAISDTETSIQCKISRLNNHIQSRDMWMKTQQSDDNVMTSSYQSKSSGKGCLSSSVKLALRAKVCKSTLKNDNSVDVFDIYKEVKELLTDIPSGDSAQCFRSDRPRMISNDETNRNGHFKRALSKKESLSDSSINKIV